jgi:hypothetical protein
MLYLLLSIGIFKLLLFLYLCNAGYGLFIYVDLYGESMGYRIIVLILCTGMLWIL